MQRNAALEKLPDNELLAYCRAHERDSAEWTVACDVLVRRYTPLVRACVRRYRDGSELTEDLMKVGYVGLLKAIGSYDPAFGNRLRAYAMPCVSGELKRYLRDRRTRDAVEDPTQGFSVLSLSASTEGDDDVSELSDLLDGDGAEFKQAVDIDAVARYWDELPSREQRVLILRYYGNLTQVEVAARLGISQMHVSRLQAQALTRLRDLLGRDRETV